MLIKKYFLLILLLFAAACNTNTKVDRQAINKEIENRKIKRVREAEILEAGMQKGREISKESEKALLNLLQKAIEQHGVAGAVEYCNTSVIPLMDSLQNEHQAEISRTSHKLRNPQNKPDDTEAEILDAYLYNEEEGLELRENVQITQDEVVLYNRPIRIGSTLCLNCHGTPKKIIQEEVLQKINNLYPEDEAKNFELGDFRGMWSIKIPKKDIVLSL